MKTFLFALLTTFLALARASATPAETHPMTLSEFLNPPSPFVWRGTVEAGSHSDPNNPILNIGIGDSSSYHPSVGMEFPLDVPFEFELSTHVASGSIAIKINGDTKLSYFPTTQWDDFFFGITAVGPGMHMLLEDVTLNGEPLRGGTFFASNSSNQSDLVGFVVPTSSDFIVHATGNFQADAPFVPGGNKERILFGGISAPEPTSAALLLGTSLLLSTKRRRRA